MKPKAIIILTAVTGLCGLMLFTRCKHQSKDAEGITQFLTLFSLQIQSKQVDSLMHHFDMPARQGSVLRLVNLLCGNTGATKNSKAIFKLEMNPTDCDIKALSDQVSIATFSVRYSRDSVESKVTTLTFSIKKVHTDQFKIVDINTKAFLKDYVEYENLVRRQTLTDKDIYSPQTLASFKTADSLKTRYDSIPWFQHMGNKTFYFVVKGKMNLEQRMNQDTSATYKMGLLNPELKEIIPLEYDLIHNIGGTFENLIEVEKDHKRGFYNVDGKVVLPAEYDQIFPVSGDEQNLAVLLKGNDYYWWKKGYAVSDKDADIKIADILPRITNYGKSVKLTEQISQSVMEYNSREMHGSIYIPPSYMVDWALLPMVQNFTNPLRKNVEYEDASSLYELEFNGKTDNENWLSSVFYSIRDNYLGGRSGLYTHKNVLVINKRNNRVYGHDIMTDMGEDEGGGELNGKCNVNSVKILSDSLYEIRAGSILSIPLYDSAYISGGPGYHYLALKNDKLVELKNKRNFAFTKYVRMDESYLNNCYEINGKQTVNKTSADMLEYMKNEIYADYKFAFKDNKWAEIFNLDPKYDKLNANVDDSLTLIDKYNINFISQKLNGMSGKSKVLAAK